MGVEPKIGGVFTSKSSILIGVSIIFTIHFGVAVWKHPGEDSQLLFSLEKNIYEFLLPPFFFYLKPLRLIFVGTFVHENLRGPE